MKFFVNSKISVLLIGFCAVLLVGARSAEADFVFGTPTNLGPVVNSSADEHPGGMTADGLALYFSSRRPGGTSEWYDIYVTTRPTKDDPWEEPVNLGPTINTWMSEWEPEISSDGLTLFFNCRWAGTVGDFDVWMTTRPTTNDPWHTPVNLGPTVNSSVRDGAPSITADGLTLFIDSLRPGGSGGWDVWMTTRSYTGGDWGTPVNLGSTVNSSASDGCPDISADGRTLFFNSRRPGGAGDNDIWMTRRPTIRDPWCSPINLGAPVNTSAFEGRPKISGDGRLLLFESGRSGGIGPTSIWQAPILPVVDFSGDEKVGIEDLVILIEYWGQNEPSVDMGPTPLGDGIVDVADLEVLMSYWGKDFRLIAHWKLDEMEGSIAYDSIAGSDGSVYGDPIWQPDGGIVDGALQLDGIDDYISTTFVLNPADDIFSVYAWIKGGAAGQVIISQEDGVDWLLADTSEGNLITELWSPGQSGSPLGSQAVITDGQWHRVGLTWDGLNRTLYVDDVEVAKDRQRGLLGSDGGLYIGAGKNLEPGSFFSGLIDDVRIYNRAVTP